MRDKLIHEYFGVDLAVVRKTLEEDVPLLKALMTQVLQVESAED